MTSENIEAGQSGAFRKKDKGRPVFVLFHLVHTESFGLTGNRGERIISEEGEPSFCLFYLKGKEDGSNEI